MDPQLPTPDADEGDDGDEVARQRRKRQPASSNPPVPAHHDPETNGETVDDLDLDLDPAEDHFASDPICASLHPSSGPRRLRTVAQLEAMLLKE
jgi:hypothetical protein